MALPTGCKLTNPLFKGLAILALTLAGSTQAFALPSFARQTGESCDACHVGSFGPQLTPHGMKFKLGGYTESDGKEGHIPLAGMLIDGYTHVSKDQPAEPGFGPNDNNAIQELSLFLAGRMTEHVGSFVQTTYSGVNSVIALDNTDVRYATETTLFGKEGTFGVSINNNPTLQDPFNTLPGFRFPYTSSEFAPSPEAAPLLDGGLEMSVLGASAYGMMTNGVYAELGAYKSLNENLLSHINADPTARIDGVAPYGRVAYYQDLKTRVWSVGLVGMIAKVRPDYSSSGPDDKHTDIGIDGHYQFLGNRKNIVSVDGSYIHESATLDASAAGDNFTVNQLALAGSYYYDKTYGATVRYLDTTTTGGDLDSQGWTLQADYSPFGKEGSWNAPWANLRVGMQYTMYNKFDGQSSGASDNDSMMLFVWLSM